MCLLPVFSYAFKKSKTVIIFKNSFIKINIFYLFNKINWIALYVNGDNVTYFDGFEAELIPKGIKKFIGNENILINTYEIQAYDSIMCRYFVLDLLILC